MTVGVGGIVRKWKLLQPEISVARVSCLSSGSFRPKLGLCILSLVLIGCCILIIVPIVSTPNLLGSLQASPLARSVKMEIIDKESVDAVAKANTEFGKKLYAELMKSKSATENVIMSPFSISSVVAMILAGAKGDTADQIRTGLSLPGDEHVLPGYKEALAALVSNENFTLDAANRLYTQEGFKLLESFLETTKNNYHADPVATDFGKSEEARGQINAWVEKQTNGKIKDLIKSGVLNAMTRLVLVNAIYFKGDWANKFDKNRTSKGTFHLADGSTVETDMMHMSRDFKVAVIKELDATALEMPYKGDRLSMIFVLPKSDMGKLEAGLPTFDFGSIKFGFPNKFDVSVPKFKLESTHDLNDPLKNLGMVDMFSDATADLSGMTGGRELYVSAVLQKAFIEVNEEGSEAAAATAGIMMMRAALITPQFNCDRPFLFMIKDNLTGLVLFNGRVGDPTKN